MPDAHRRMNDALYEQFARIGKAVSAQKRLERLELQRERRGRSRRVATGFCKTS